MSEGINWECPYCGCHTTLIEEKSIQIRSSVSTVPGKHLENDEHYYFITSFIACPNADCKELAFEARLSTAHIDPSPYAKNKSIESRFIKQWTLMPRGIFKQYPEYIPYSIRSDYQEACQIKDLSPKAAATLARRCLQGMIRDFWEIKDSTLYNEISKLEDKIPQEIFNAIDTIRKIGNVGAHMEKDINQIIEIDENEVDQLIWLIELLMKEWYIDKHDREEKLQDLQALGAKKNKDDLS